MKSLSLLSIIITMLLTITGCSNAEADVDYTNQSATIIDVRTLDEWNSGHLSRAQRVEWQNIEVAAQQLNLDKNEPVFLYCKSGNRAGKAQKLLEKMGYTQVYNLGGVADASQATGDKIVR